ncbi:MAG: hypothetical protein SGJ10_03020 [Bacteroidota bacterium]|nr:hypothetical protein [Bacteroidota bacterium]
MKKYIIFLFFLLTSAGEIFAQCSMCKANAKTASEGGSNIGKGLNAGIEYMLIVPYLAAIVVGILWYLNYRKKQASANVQ